MDKTLTPEQIAEAKKLSAQIGIVLDKMPPDWEPNKGTAAVPVGILINLRMPIDYITSSTGMTKGDANKAFEQSKDLFIQQWTTIVKPALATRFGKDPISTDGILTKLVMDQIDFIKTGVQEFAQHIKP